MVRTLLLVICLCSLILFSCSNDNVQLWAVQNDSSTDIVVQLDASATSYNSETFVPTGIQEVIANLELPDEMPVSPTSIINAINIFNEAGDTTLKDPRQDANWVLTPDGPEDNPGDIRFILTLTDDDF